MNEQTIISLIEKFQSLNLSAVIDFDKFNRYAITHHSTCIEGSTLTENETRLLLDEGATPAGKPLVHSLMVQDHYNALLFIIQKAKEKIAVTPAFIQTINAAVMKQTGVVYKTVFGELDAAAGKPLVHSLMVRDHYNALLFIIQKAKEKIAVTRLLYKQSMPR